MQLFCSARRAIGAASLDLPGHFLKPRYGQSHAVDNARTQYSVPVLSHGMEKLGAVNCVGVLQPARKAPASSHLCFCYKTVNFLLRTAAGHYASAVFSIAICPA